MSSKPEPKIMTISDLGDIMLEVRDKVSKIETRLEQADRDINGGNESPGLLTRMSWAEKDIIRLQEAKNSGWEFAKIGAIIFGFIVTTCISLYAVFSKH